MIMLVMKNESWYAEPARAVNPIATMIETMDSTSGTAAATADRKTRSRMISAIGIPMSSAF